LPITPRLCFSVRPRLEEGLEWEQLCRIRDVQPAVELRRLLQRELHHAREAGELPSLEPDDDRPALLPR